MTIDTTPSAPHECPNCGEPAYVGGPGVPTQCTSRVCPFYSEDCWVRWVMELPDEPDPDPEDFGDEDTLPGYQQIFIKDMYSSKGQLNLPTWDDLHSNSKHPPRKKDLDND